MYFFYIITVFGSLVEAKVDTFYLHFPLECKHQTLHFGLYGNDEMKIRKKIVFSNEMEKSNKK
jgi:hypothetical protein